MNINVFLLCYNESALLPHVIKHYKKYLPSCKITIYDNESTDNSVEIAKNLGCSVVSWNSKNISDENIRIKLRNNIWKEIDSGWIIMADMDEFLCVTEDELMNEMKMGTTILRIQGYNMLGETETLDLSDIDLQEIKKYVEDKCESKYLCFFREAINEMNYGPGSHKCKPNGKIAYSSTIYINKHMNFLGLNYYRNKILNRYARSHKMRQQGMSGHYISDVAKIDARYTTHLKNCKFIL